MAHTEVDAFLRAYAYPALKAAGFRRKGREVSITGPDGRIGFVAFRSYKMPQAPGFYCAYGMVTPGHSAWWRERGASPSSVPLLGSALMMVQVHAPDSARSLEVMGRPDWWGLYRGYDDAERGKRMSEVLVEQVIPDLNSWLDPAVLADDIARRRDGVIPLMNPWPVAEAMALLDVEGAEERLKKTLELIPPDYAVRVWIEGRLATRSPN
jgi:hypothetical protein